jgi:hypothetical protein
VPFNIHHATFSSKAMAEIDDTKPESGDQGMKDERLNFELRISNEEFRIGNGLHSQFFIRNLKFFIQSPVNHG